MPVVNQAHARKATPSRAQMIVVVRVGDGPAVLPAKVLDVRVDTRPITSPNTVPGPTGFPSTPRSTPSSSPEGPPRYLAWPHPICILNALTSWDAPALSIPNAATHGPADVNTPPCVGHVVREPHAPNAPNTRPYRRRPLNNAPTKRARHLPKERPTSPEKATKTIGLGATPKPSPVPAVPAGLLTARRWGPYWTRYLRRNGSTAGGASCHAMAVVARTL